MVQQEFRDLGESVRGRVMECCPRVSVNGVDVWSLEFQRELRSSKVLSLSGMYEWRQTELLSLPMKIKIPPGRVITVGSGHEKVWVGGNLIKYVFRVSRTQALQRVIPRLAALGGYIGSAPDLYFQTVPISK